MLVIAGLGNPGDRHERNRHNVGFMAVDAVARHHSFSPWRQKFRAYVSEGRLAGVRTLLVKPQTFMNRSGESIGEALRFHKLSTDALVVMYDEIDLAPGKVRVKRGGGAGGHNGIRSIDSHCGKDYARVRIGIGHPGDKARVHGHVLGDFAKSDGEWLDPLLDAIGEHAPLLAGGEESTFMNRVALAVADKAPASAAAKDKPAKNGASGSKPKAQSHIRQARARPAAAPPKSGPMADMLKKLFGSKED